MCLPFILTVPVTRVKRCHRNSAAILSLETQHVNPPLEVYARHGQSRRRGKEMHVSPSLSSLRSGRIVRASMKRRPMPTRILLTVILSLLCAAPAWIPSDALARGSGSSHSSGSHSSDHYSYKGHSHSKADPGVQRNSHGRIKRSPVAKDHFKKSHPCPSTGKSRGSCPGYVIDHVVPLKRGGADSPENMQWQTKEAAKLKDRTE